MIHTIRFRLTVLYSGLLFVLAALVLGGIYYAVSKTTDQRPYTTEYAKVYNDGRYVDKRPVVFVEEVENAINVRTMTTLRDYCSTPWPASTSPAWASAGCCPAACCARSGRSPVPRRTSRPRT